MADQDIVNKLNTLNTTYLNSINNAFLGNANYGTFGTCADGSQPQSARDLQCQLMQYIYTGSSTVDSDYALIPIKYNGGTAASTIPQSDGNICIYDASAPADYTRVLPTQFKFNGTGLDATSTSACTGDSVNFNNSACAITTDINCMGLLLQAADSGSTIRGIPLTFYCLQGLYAWYAMLDKDNFNKYKNNLPVTLDIPDITVGSGAHPSMITFTSVTIQQQNGSATSSNRLTSQNTVLTTNSTFIISGTTTGSTPPFLLQTGSSIPTIIDLMNFIVPFTDVNSNGIFDQTSFDPFTARRIIHLHIIMLQYQIAETYISTNLSTDNSRTQIAYAIGELLNSANTSLMEPSDGAFVNILNGVQLRSQQYNSDQIKITDLSTKVGNLQTNITKDSNNLSQELIYQKTIQRYQYIAFVLFGVVLFSCIGMYVNSNSETNHNVYIAGVLLIIAIVVGFVLNYYLNNTLTSEGFYDGPQVYPDFPTTASVADQLTAIRSNLILPHAKDYLTNTLMITSTLNNYNLYGRVNIGMDNQYSYYNDAANSLAVKDQNIKNFTQINYILQLQYAARMQLAVSLSIILSIVAASYYSLAGSPVAQSYVTIVGALFVVGAIIVYILQVVGNVRNYPKQYYWGNPNISKNGGSWFPTKNAQIQSNSGGNLVIGHS